MTRRHTASSAMRLDAQPGEVLDRDSQIRFSFNGKEFVGHTGDTIVSALAAAGVRVFSRSFKYHRPRGLMTASYHDPGCILQVGDEPNVRAAHRQLAEGMDVRSQNTWPSLRFDVKAVNQLAGRFLPPGFYYKTFIKPQRLWPAYEKVLQRFAHAGEIHPDTPHDYYDKRYAHPDVLIAGGGPAGMAAAISAARAGSRVMLVEEEHALGGSLRWGDADDRATLAGMREIIAAEERIEILTDSVVAARYDGNWIAVVQRNLPGVPERLIKARAGAFVVAAGTIERPYVFEGNDLPGVMLSTAVRRLINLWAVKPGERAVVLTANDSGDAAIEDLRRAGVEIAHVADARSGEGIVRALGRGGVRAVELTGGRRIEADLLVTAVGWTTPTALLNTPDKNPRYEPEAARFLPYSGITGDGVFAAGAVAADHDPGMMLADADSIGQVAAAHAAEHRAVKLATTPTVTDSTAPSVPPSALSGHMWEGHPELYRASTHGFVDFSEDVSSKDIYAAVAEGYDSAELAKRYTTATMGPTQGKLELMNTIAVLAEATGRTIAETGTTTWRPMYAPVTLGALAGRIFEPVRHSPVQGWHERNGAHPLVAGQWIRPEHYGSPAAEVRAVREHVGIIDVTPIGKLDLRGPDVPKLLNLLYVNKWSKLDVGRVRYGVMCAEDGVVLDDGVTGRLGEDHYLMSTTSSGAATVWEWVENWLQTTHPDWRVHVTPVTTAYASINVAGPRSRELVARLTEDVDFADFDYMRVRTGRIAGVDGCVLWRIGFTGELSYELHVPADHGQHVWDALLEHGADLGVRAFGVEAQRILRLEKGHFIVGQDTDGLTKAFSAGLDGLVKLDKDDFVGKPELVWQDGRGDRLVAVRPDDPTVVPAEASQILDGGGIAGRITSSRMSPTLGRSICLAQVRADLTEPGTTLSVRLPDGRTVTATVAEHLAAVDPDGERQRATGPVPEPRQCTTPEPASPITVHTTPTAAALTLTDESGLAKVLIRAPHDGAAATLLGVPFGRSIRDGWLVVGSGPGEWLVLDEPGTAAALRAGLAGKLSGTGEFVSVLDLSPGRALIRLTGRRAADLLAKVCAVDLAEDITPNGSAFRTSVAKLVTDIVRDDVDGVPSYLLHCERSSGQYLFDALLDAGAEFGIGVHD